MEYPKYTKASGELFETAGPTQTGDRTLSFTEKQDAIWVNVLVGTNNKGSFNYANANPVTLIIDGVTIQAKQKRLLEVAAKEITVDVGIAHKVWFQIIGLKNK